MKKREKRLSYNLVADSIASRSTTTGHDKVVRIYKIAAVQRVR
jgi:hypothetical protein